MIELQIKNSFQQMCSFKTIDRFAVSGIPW